MNSTLSDKVNGFLNRRSLSHWLWPLLNKGPVPISISSQSLIGSNSTAADGPTLVFASERPLGRAAQLYDSDGFLLALFPRMCLLSGQAREYDGGHDPGVQPRWVETSADRWEFSAKCDCVTPR